MSPWNIRPGSFGYVGTVLRLLLAHGIVPQTLVEGPMFSSLKGQQTGSEAFSEVALLGSEGPGSSPGKGTAERKA